MRGGLFYFSNRMTNAPRLNSYEFNYSLKNIPTGSKKEYVTRLYDQTSKFVEQIRWKVFHYCNNKEDDNKEVIVEDNYKYPTKKFAPQNDMLKPFEQDLFGLIKSIKFRKVHSKFQQVLRNDVKLINESKDVFAFADKTGNVYQMKVDDYTKILHENITKDYEGTAERTLDAINEEAKEMIKKASATGKIPKFSKTPAFVSIKDHKPDFPHKIKCRLVNPAKTHIGKISKHILDRVIPIVRTSAKLIQWKNSFEVIEWFNAINDKESKCFLKFDIVDFYPSIKRDHIVKAIHFARRFCDISESEEEIIFHTCKTILTDLSGNLWKKKHNNDLFDVPMGSFHGAEVCDLVGLYILDKLSTVLPSELCGLYRDDGLAIVKKTSPCHIERLTKSIRKVFGGIGFKITVENTLDRTDFLDVVLDLRENDYKPYKKPNAKTAYIHNESNHPGYIRKSLPTMIHKRICKLSKNKEAFESVRNNYDEALTKSGYQKLEEYELQKDTNMRSRKRKRKRKVIFYHPPYCASVKTNIGKAFLKIIDKSFPKSHELRGLLNRSTVKLSYCCLPNMKTIISRHNRGVIRRDTESKSQTSQRTCDCARNRTCPLDGKCLQRNVIYKATVESEKETVEYVGSTCDTFKRRYMQHISDIRLEKLKKCTLVKYICELKKDNTNYKLKWKILHKGPPGYGSAGTSCTVCNLERMAIAEADRVKSLNKRSELVAKCPHRRRMYF